MRTPRQIAAARANGAKSRGPKTPEGKLAAAANAAKSTGPVTPEGKARSSRNATRHALLATSVVLHGEAEDRFCALLAGFEDELLPETPIESAQVEVMTVAHWRRMRIWSLEKVIYAEEELKRQAAAEESGDAEDEEGDPPIVRMARSLRSLADQSRVLELLNRYETRYGREFLRGLACIHKQRAQKSAASRTPPEIPVQLPERSEPGASNPANPSPKTN